MRLSGRILSGKHLLRKNAMGVITAALMHGILSKLRSFFYFFPFLTSTFLVSFVVGIGRLD